MIETDNKVVVIRLGENDIDVRSSVSDSNKGQIEFKNKETKEPIVNFIDYNHRVLITFSDINGVKSLIDRLTYIKNHMSETI